jgi:hypothetical protein
MQYKTIVLELLWQFPETHDRLRASRALLATVDRLAEDLKDRHESWKRQLAQTGPNYTDEQITSAALEFATTELEASLLPDSAEEGDPPSLDGAMASLHRLSPPA